MLPAAFHLPGFEPRCIKSYDGKEVLCYSYPLSDVGAKQNVKHYVHVLDSSNAKCLLCRQDIAICNGKLWNAQKHFIYNHQSLCSYEVLDKYSVNYW